MITSNVKQVRTTPLVSEDFGKEMDEIKMAPGALHINKVK